MPQTGFDPPAQSDTSYEADALLQSHHGWIWVGLFLLKKNDRFISEVNFYIGSYSTLNKTKAAIHQAVLS